jgi:hypothetical protein
VNFLEELGFKLFALGMSDTWAFFHKGEIIFKATQTISGKMLISDSSGKVLLSTRDKLEMITFLTSELRDFKIDKLL